MFLLHIKLLALELVSLPHFLHNFWRKIFLMLYSINWPNLIVFLHFLYEVLGNMRIVIVCFPVCDAINFQIYLKFKYLKNENSSWDEIKNIMTVCSYHVTYAFQSESTLYICLNVKELLARNRHDIGLAKWLSVRLRTKWLWVESRCSHLKNIIYYFQRAVIKANKTNFFTGKWESDLKYIYVIKDMFIKAMLFWAVIENRWKYFPIIKFCWAKWQKIYFMKYRLIFNWAFWFDSYLLIFNFKIFIIMVF